MIDRNPDDDWAMVELFRWQYGTLPQPGDNRKLNVAEGLAAMSAAIKKRLTGDCTVEVPGPMSVRNVLDYLARKANDFLSIDTAGLRLDLTELFLLREEADAAREMNRAYNAMTRIPGHHHPSHRPEFGELDRFTVWTRAWDRYLAARNARDAFMRREPPDYMI